MNYSESERYQEAKKHLAGLRVAEDEPTTFQLFDDSPAKRPHFAKVIHGSLKEKFEILLNLLTVFKKCTNLVFHAPTKIVASA